MQTNRHILTQELENTAILKDLIKSISGDDELDKTYIEIVVLLTNKVLESLKDDPTLEVKVPDSLMNDLRQEIQKEIRNLNPTIELSGGIDINIPEGTSIDEITKEIKREARKSCI